MSKFSGYLYHPINHHPESVYTGFSWPCFFVSPLWYAAKGVWTWALISLALNLFTYGIGGIFLACYANEQHRQFLLGKGYLTEEQLKDKNE